MILIPSFKFDSNEVHLCGAFMCNARLRYVVLKLSELLETARCRRITFLATPLLSARFNNTNTSRVQPY